MAGSCVRLVSHAAVARRVPAADRRSGGAGMEQSVREDLGYRKQVARAILSSEIAPLEVAAAEPAAEAAAEQGLVKGLPVPWPDGLGPVPQPPAATPDPQAPLPHADVLVVTWTVAEQKALADVLTPGHSPPGWFPYRRRFIEDYQAKIRPWAPARAVGRLGSWYPVKVGSLTVLCYKSELHLNQDGIRTGAGTATLPVRDMFAQLIDEVRPRLVLTIGTSGGVLASDPNTAAIRLAGVDFPEFHPILTTDYFEFGTSGNHLEKEGCAVEMGDAVLGMVCEGLADPPKWGVVRNLSDPQINADLPVGAGQLNMQVHWALWYYTVFGYWTSVAGALATWGVIAGLDGT